MVQIEKYVGSVIDQLPIMVAGRVLYDNTINALRYNDSTSYNNILLHKDINNNLSSINNVTTSGTLGINTSAPDRQVEINSATGDCLRLTYNDNNGGATNYTDLSVSSSGNLTLNIAEHNGVDKGLELGGVLVTATAAELNYLDIGSPGIAQESKVLIVDENRNLVNMNYLEVAQLTSIKQSASDNAVEAPVSLLTTPADTAADGLGTGLEFLSVNDQGAIFPNGYFNCVTSDVTTDSETSYFDFRLTSSGALDSVMTISDLGVCSTSSFVELSDERIKENIESVDQK